METMINLNDLLKHEILDLYSAEEQIIEAMPAMIERAKNPELKKALREHLKITQEQKNRLDKVKGLMGEGNGEEGGEKKGFFSRLFGGGSGGEKCKGMEGLITEGEKIMAADITEEALDAAIIASAQKIEHYEICGYGTARAFARELQLAEVERLLSQTLNEEYTSDDLLTALAVGKLNLEAEQADGSEARGRSGRSNRTGGGSKSKSSGSSKGASSKGGGSKGSSKGGSSKGGSSKGGSKSSGRGSSNGGSKGGSKSGGNSKGGASKGSGAKSSSKGGSSKGGNKSSGSNRGGSSKGGSSKGGSSKGGSSKGGGSKGSSKGGTSRGR